MVNEDVDLQAKMITLTKGQRNLKLRELMK